MKNTDMRAGFILFAISILAIASSACSRGANVNSNININANANVNANTTGANVNAATAPSTIAAREPDTYKATIVFTAQTEGGDRTVGIPQLSADVARSGNDRRLSFKLPDGSDLVYLEKGGVQYGIAPARKQYAELTPEATGFQLHRLMTPGQLVAHLDRLKGIEFVGEEQQAGRPLRAELFGEASGNVQGVKGANLVAEMRNITTSVDPSLFEIPTGFNKVPEAQVRAQVDAVANTLLAVLRALLEQRGAAPPPPSPTVSPTVSPSPR
jgi:hypothetical protein